MSKEISDSVSKTFDEILASMKSQGEKSLTDSQNRQSTSSIDRSSLDRSSIGNRYSIDNRSSIDRSSIGNRYSLDSRESTLSLNYSSNEEPSEKKTKDAVMSITNFKKRV